MRNYLQKILGLNIFVQIFLHIFVQIFGNKIFAQIFAEKFAKKLAQIFYGSYLGLEHKNHMAPAQEWGLRRLLVVRPPLPWSIPRSTIQTFFGLLQFIYKSRSWTMNKHHNWDKYWHWLESKLHSSWVHHTVIHRTQSECLIFHLRCCWSLQRWGE